MKIIYKIKKSIVSKFFTCLCISTVTIYTVYSKRYTLHGFRTGKFAGLRVQSQCVTELMNFMLREKYSRYHHTLQNTEYTYTYLHILSIKIINLKFEYSIHTYIYLHFCIKCEQKDEVHTKGFMLKNAQLIFFFYSKHLKFPNDPYNWILDIFWIPIIFPWFTG